MQKKRHKAQAKKIALRLVPCAVRRFRRKHDATEGRVKSEK
jgi:hypothetical protein